MCDPVKRPLTWSKKYYVYAERHGIYDVMQALMKELAVWRPVDPLLYVKDEIKRIGMSIYSPKVFMIGPEPLSPLLAEGISNHCGAKFFTLKSIIQNTTPEIRTHLLTFLDGEDSSDETQRKLLIATLARRLVSPDCVKNGYVLYGFPQSRSQALMAQASGLIPRQVFVLMPPGPPEAKRPSTLNPSATSADSSNFTDIFSAEKPRVEYTVPELIQWKEYFGMKDTAMAYSADSLRVKSYEKWNMTDPHDLEAEYLGVLITKPSTGAPWIPRILLIGPPGAGKRTIAEKLAMKYKVSAFSWIELIRGAIALDDEYSDECRMFLDNFTPPSDECVKSLLTRRFYRDDCMKKGFVLFGFPETANQALVLDTVALSPNRVFLLSCPPEVSQKRIGQKKMQVMSRRTPNHPIFYKNPNILDMEISGEVEKEVETFRQNPYSPEAIASRFEFYNQNLPGVLRHYGSSIIYVDASEELDVVIDFVHSCTLRPPNVRFD